MVVAEGRLTVASVPLVSFIDFLSLPLMHSSSQKQEQGFSHTHTHTRSGSFIFMARITFNVWLNLVTLDARLSSD